jgi:hypothetical protein
VQLAEELLDGGLRRSAPPASPEADVVPGVASEQDAGGHQRLDEIELGALQQARLIVSRYRDGWIDQWRSIRYEYDGRPSITYRVLGIVVEEGAASVVDDLGVAFSAIAISSVQDVVCK